MPRKYVPGPFLPITPERINRLPKWVRNYLHDVGTFVGAEEIQEIFFLRDQNRSLVKLVGELKARIAGHWTHKTAHADADNFLLGMRQSRESIALCVQGDEDSDEPISRTFNSKGGQPILCQRHGRQ